MDGVISQATHRFALGVSEVFPVISKRTKVKSTTKVDRWNKIALESTKQCGRATPPVVSEPVDFQDRTLLESESKAR